MTCTDPPPAHPSARHVHAAPPFSPASVLLRRRSLTAALAVLLVAFAVAAALRHGQLLLTWDEPIQRGVEAHRTSVLDHFFLAVSRLGSTVVVLALGALATVATWRRCRAVATALLVATLSRPLLEFAVKALVGRDRPDFGRMVGGNGPSFPSGHVMAAVALWGLLPLVVSLYTRSRALWWAAFGTSATLIVSIAASRVYLGVHWFSDVTAGLVVGAFFLLGVEAVLTGQHRRHPCRLLPEVTLGSMSVPPVDPVTVPPVDPVPGGPDELVLAGVAAGAVDVPLVGSGHLDGDRP
ncbi:MAG TPA: phosphatase PAP2 family protein [Acidimicrobiales bacterium]